MKLFSPFTVTDEQAMWRVQMEDDPTAFAMLVDRWQTPIRNLCTRMLGDLHRGEDLAQETFLRVFANRKRYVASARFSTFLWRVALNLCTDELRRRERRRETALGENEDPGSEEMVCQSASPDIAAADQETAHQVRSALAELSEPYRAVLILRHYEGLKFRDIAEVLEIPEGTVKSRMAEGLTQMGRLLNASKTHEPRPKNAAANRREALAL